MIQEAVEYLKSARWDRQHGWRRAIWRGMARMGLTGVHSLPMHRRWIDIHRRPMPLRNLDPVHAGLKIVQISDIHYSPVVWTRYVHQYVEWVNSLRPDFVFVTGDLITGGYRYARQISEILSHLKTTHGVICTFGNHDYGMFGKSQPNEATRRGNYLQENLESRGLIVLRNETLEVKLSPEARPLVIVGLDDEWSGRIDPDRAFAAIICLNHNPVNTLELMKYPWQWMLAGHTHGRQLGHTMMGRVFNKKRYRHYTRGYYAVEGRHLYVNRGLSYGQRVMDWCRPEVTVFTLSREESVDA